MGEFGLRDLRSFVAIVDEGHVTRAATRLGMQQPHLSRLLLRLETEFQTALMVRGPRGVTCTAAGKALAEGARGILSSVDSLQVSVLRAARGETGRLTIGYTSSAALHPTISATIRTFRQQYGAVLLALEEAGTGDLIAAVEAGIMDGAFIRTPIADRADLDVTRVLSEPMVVAFPKGHALLATPKSVSMNSLSEEPFILYRRSSGPGFYDAIVSACRKAGFSPFIAQEAPRLTATLSLVAAGLGVTIVPASMQSMRIDGIDFRELRSAAGLNAVIDFVTRSGDPSPTLRSFAALLGDAVA